MLNAYRKGFSRGFEDATNGYDRRFITMRDVIKQAFLPSQFTNQFFAGYKSGYDQGLLTKV